MKKIVMLIFCLLIIILTACASNEKMLEQKIVDWYVDSGEMNTKELDNRMTLEAYTICSRYWAENLDWDSKYQPKSAKYGVEKFLDIRNVVLFKSLEDMKTVMANYDFRTDYSKEYKTDVPDHYYLSRQVSGDWYEAAITFLNNEYYFNISCLDPFNHEIIRWDVYENSINKSAKDIIEFYAGIDDNEVQSQMLNNGNLVYFVTSGNSEFFLAAGAIPAETCTGYLWEQEGVLGTIIIRGEHKPENLDLCVLERYEF